MQPYTEIITNKDTIDKATHVFAPSKPKDLKTYRMVFNTISVERMNSILFDDSTIVRSSQSGTTTYNNNTGVANYNDKDEMYHYKNLSEDAKSSSNMQETIPGTYEFINSHGGFLNDDSSTVTQRLINRTSMKSKSHGGIKAFTIINVRYLRRTSH